MTAGTARRANRWVIVASFGGQAVMMLAAASVAVTAATHPPVPATITTPRPALIAPRNPGMGTPSGITLLPYVQTIGGQVKNPYVAP